MRDTLKKLFGLLLFGAAIAAVVAYLFKDELLPEGAKDEEEEDELMDFDEDLSDLFDDFQDDVPVIRLDAEEEIIETEEEAEEPAEESEETTAE